MVIVTFAFPFIIEGHEHDLGKKTEHLKWLSIIVGLVTSFFVITGYFYMIETEGLEKEDIYYILRGQKTREECLKVRRAEKQNSGINYAIAENDVKKVSQQGTPKKDLRKASEPIDQ